MKTELRNKYEIKYENEIGADIGYWPICKIIVLPEQASVHVATYGYLNKEKFLAGKEKANEVNSAVSIDLSNPIVTDFLDYVQNLAESDLRAQLKADKKSVMKG